MAPAATWQRKGAEYSSAFSLVELLVVLAVIGVLAALLFPALARAKSKSHSAVCMNNQRQIALDFREKVDEFDQRLDRYEMWLWWFQDFGLRKIWLCPSAPVRNSRFDDVFRAWRVATGDPPVPREGGYAFNYYLLDAGRYSGDVPDMPEKAFLLETQMKPDLTPITVDSANCLVTPEATDLPATNLAKPGSWPYDQGMWMVAIPRHGSSPSSPPRDHPVTEPLPGAVNVGFYDGHVETVKLDRLWQLYWHRGYQAPAKRPGLK